MYETSIVLGLLKYYANLWKSCSSIFKVINVFHSSETFYKYLLRNFAITNLIIYNNTYFNSSAGFSIINKELVIKRTIFKKKKIDM